MLVLAALSQDLFVHNAAKMSSPWLNAFTAFAGTVYWCFIYFSEHLVNEKKQYYTFNISSILQMLGKDHELFLKKILKVFSVTLVYIIPNLALRLYVYFFTIAITRLFNVIAYNNNVTV